MHQIYHTNAFILSSYNIGEANKVFYLYTKELGLVRTIAQSIRLNKSKLRFALQDFSYAKVDLVRGRDIWRITSALTINSFPFARSKKQSLFLIARVSKLLERLCVGEESNEKIFDDLIQVFYLLDDFDKPQDLIEALELHLVLRIMNSLGYIGESLVLKHYISSDFDSNLTQSLLSERKLIINHINKALNESQL